MAHAGSTYRVRGAVVAFAALLLAGCATSPPPTDKLALAKAAVSDAVSAGGAEFAPGTLRSAQDNLDKANAAMTNWAYGDAQHFAEAAEVDARLAAAAARSRKAQRAVAEVDSGIRALQEEIARTGVR